MAIKLDILETPVTVTPSRNFQKLYILPKSLKILKVYFWEITSTLGEITINLGEMRLTCGDSRRFRVFGIHFFIGAGEGGWDSVGRGPRRGFRKYLPDRP